MQRENKRYNPENFTTYQGERKRPTEQVIMNDCFEPYRNKRIEKELARSQRAKKINNDAFKDKEIIYNLKELDDKIDQLKEEVKNLEIMESVTKESAQIINLNDNDLSVEEKHVNQDFYDDIEMKLQMAEEILHTQLKYD